MLSPAEFVTFVRTARLAVVATTSPEGTPEAALVEIAVTDDGALLFDTKSGTRKVANISHQPRVAIVVGWNDSVSVQVEGPAEILAGTDRTDAAAVFESQFPGSRALADGFALIRVKPDWLCYYDARPESFEIEGGAWPVETSVSG
jgi:pyridoxine/pyridoxamine 5'-phosphate oxidase